jgi:putative PIN family toxin of toxin-antitoxin system
MHRIVLDANVWIKYARSRDIAPLLDRFVTYNFLPVVNNYLLSEIFDAVVENRWMSRKSAEKLIGFIRKVAWLTAENAVYRLSPDPKDNYLFDLAVQNNCVFLITDDTELLGFRLPPLPVHSSGWFLKTFAL